MKSIKVDYTDPDNRTITIVDDNDEERVLELEVDESEHSIKVDGEHTIEIDDETFAVTRATAVELKAKAKDGKAVFLALIGLFISGSVIGLGAFCVWKVLELIFG